MMDIGKELQAAFDDGYAARDKEIVRCGECKIKDECMEYEISKNDDFYCGYGERKDGETDGRTD